MEFAARGETEVTRESRLPAGDVEAGEKFCVIVNLFPKPEFLQEFLECIAANKRGTDETEQKALQYSWGESGDAEFSFLEVSSVHSFRGFVFVFYFSMSAACLLLRLNL